ncbi:MAG: RICIN domain-containing protein [Bacteroidetes bacterium]|nr:RICIN domain-containing protein [Bacteroidota bacterium]
MEQYRNHFLIFLFMFLFSSDYFAQYANDLIPKNEPFFIQSANDYGKRNFGYWDIPGGEENISEKAPLKVWELSDKNRDRKYVVVNSDKSGFVKIHIEGVAAYIDIVNAENKNGAKLQIYKPNNSSAQNFSFMYMGNGRFKIFNENGKMITVNGRSSDNGSEIQMWDNHDGSWGEWYLISAVDYRTIKLEDNFAKKGDNMSGIRKVIIQSAMNYGKNSGGFFDVPGREYPKSGDNVTMWELSDYDIDRQYEIINSISDFSYYNISIADNSNLLLDLTNNDPANGSNIGLWERNGSAAQNFYFKHLGNGRFKIYNQNGKAVTLSNRTANGSNVHIWDDHDGPWMEWYLIDTETNKVFSPENNDAVPSNISSIGYNGNSCGESKTLAANIDNTFNEINRLETRTEQAYTKVKSAYSSVGSAYSAVNNINSLNSRVDDTYNAISVFTKIPTIGTAETVLSTGLNIAKNKLNSVNELLSKIKEPIIAPANNNIQYSFLSIQLFNSQLKKLKTDLYSIKQHYSNIDNSILTSNNDQQKKEFETKCRDLNLRLADITGSLSTVESSISDIETICGSVESIGKPINHVDNGVKNFNKVFSKTDRIADEINKILNQRFQKEIKGVGINISLRDVLEGGKVGKLFEKYVSPWVDDLTSPIMDKLNIRMPEVPGVDSFKEAITNSLDLTKKVRDRSLEIENIGKRISEHNVEFENLINAGGSI